MIRKRGAALVLVALAACANAATPPPTASAPPSVASATATPSVAPDAAAPVSTSAPIRIDGYPAPLHNGFSDPVNAFGYLRDGKTYAYCRFVGCCRNDDEWCELIAPDGTVTSLDSPVRFADDPTAKNHVKRSIRDLEAIPQIEGLAVLGPDRDMTRTPPPVTGDIAHGSELTLVWKDVSGTLRVGGYLPGEKPVLVAAVPTPAVCTESKMCAEVELNGVSVSPTGELAFLGFFHLPSHGAAFSVLKIDSAKLAATIFNDTGMAHHKKEDWLAAANLFQRAWLADPTSERFAYNLACALARRSDPSTEKALTRAVTIGGDVVKKRAQKDADFASVRDAPWFKSLTQ